MKVYQSTYFAHWPVESQTIRCKMPFDATKAPACRLRRRLSGRRMKVRNILFPLLLVSLCVGCGPKRPAMAPVKGKVLLDGQPLNTGNVGTIPTAGRGAHGDIQS